MLKKTAAKLRSAVRRMGGTALRRRSSDKAETPRGGTVIATTAPQDAPRPMQVATVYACVRLLSEAVAQLPFRYMERTRGGLFAEGDAWLNRLLQVEPCERCGAFDFKRQMVSRLLLRGNAFILPMQSPVARRVDRFVLLDGVSYSQKSDTYFVSDTVNGISGTFDGAEIIHIHTHHTVGGLGLGIIASARHTIGIASRGDGETLSRLQNGGGVLGVLSSPSPMDGVGLTDDGEVERVSVDVEADLRAGKRIISLPNMVDFKQLSLSSADLQFLETRKFEVREICRFFGVHPSYVFDDTSNNYKSAEMANAAFLSQTLNPLLCNIENEFGRKLAWMGDGRFEFDRSGLFVGDRESLVRYQTAQLQAGLRSPNELRRADNMPPVDGGDTLFISANLRPITESATNDNNDNNDNNDGQD